MQATPHIAPSGYIGPAGGIGLCMKGTVRCKRPCARCGKPFQWSRPAEALVCLCGQRAEAGIYIDLHWGKPSARLKLYSTKKGETFDSGRQAMRTLEAIRLDIDSDTFRPEDYQEKKIAEMRWEHYVSGHLARLEQRHAGGRLAGKTLKNARLMCRLYLAPLLKGRDIRQIRAGHLSDAAAKLATMKTRAGEPISASTQATAMRRLHAIFNEALAREDISRVPSLPPVEEPIPDHDIPTEEQRVRIFAQIPKRHARIFTTLRHQPLRPVEVCRAVRTSLSLEPGILFVPRKSRKTGPALEQPLHRDVLACLAETEQPPTLLLFAHLYRGEWRAYTTNCLDDIWRAAARAAGLQQFRLYVSTRHFIATRAVRAGVDIGKVSKALGHTSITHTARTYAHYNADAVRDVIELPTRQEDRPQTGPKGSR